MKITRGDTAGFKFQRIGADGNPITVIADKIYFTVKTDDYTQKTVIQKTIEDMTFDSDGTYHFTIDPEDTNNLDYGSYLYDVEVRIPDSNYTQTISKGRLEITSEITFASNEV